MSTTQFVEVAGGRIAYDVIGEGPLIVLSPGLADIRRTYRFLAPLLADAGYRVASVDLRGHGESSVGWSSYTHADTAGDLLEVIRTLGGPATIIGQSFSGGSATIAAATQPELVAAAIEIAPFTRAPGFSLGAFLRNDHNYRRGGIRLGRFALSGSIATWIKYLDVAYPGRKPDDWDEYVAEVSAALARTDGTSAALGMLRSSVKYAASLLPTLRRSVLVVMGTADSDFADPEGDAAAIINLLPDGLGGTVLIDGAGHYPHAEYPEQVTAALLPFLKDHAHA